LNFEERRESLSQDKETQVVKNTQQWCPTAETVVVLTVRGEVKGSLIEGDVVDCNRYECKISSSTKSFCWLKRHILTAIW